MSHSPLPSPLPVALTVAGSDSSAGAGIQADLKTFAAHGVYGVCAVTAVVAEIPGRVEAWEAVGAGLLASQLSVLGEGFEPGAAKTGMLATASLVETVCAFLEREGSGLPLVVDPVMVASSGDLLLEQDAVALYEERLLPMASLATPNLAETAVLLGREVSEVASLDQESAARDFSERYRCPVLVKGGHWQSGEDAVDLLWDGSSVQRFRAKRIAGADTHGTGCTLSAAIAAGLALGRSLPDAVASAKEYVTAAIREAHAWRDPQPLRALNHFPEKRSLPAIAQI